MIPHTKMEFLAGEPSARREDVALRPKRRFKINQPSSRKSAVDDMTVSIESPLPGHTRMKRSGRVHQEWHTPSEFCPPEPKLPAAPASHELLGPFMEVSTGRSHDPSPARMTVEVDNQQPPLALENVMPEPSKTTRPYLHSLGRSRRHSDRLASFRRLRPQKAKLIRTCTLVVGILICTWQAFRPHPRSR
jgi:hypothetical protein